jgi:hypothetical protein
MTELLMNDKLGRMRKEAVVDTSNLLSRPSPKETKENHETPQWEQSVSRPKFKLGTLRTQVRNVTACQLVWSESYIETYIVRR